tara:strand:+ start:1549 stop:1737 length:189 start_codon:yes stop_codon:yes gene_type:complete
MSVVCDSVNTTLDSRIDIIKNKRRKQKGVISLIEKMSICVLEETEIKEVVFDNFYLFGCFKK